MTKFGYCKHGRFQAPQCVLCEPLDEDAMTGMMITVSCRLLRKLEAAQAAMEAYEEQWIQCPFCHQGWGGEDEERLHPGDCLFKAWEQLP